MVQLTREIITKSRDLRSPYARVIIGDTDQFFLGDGRLRYVKVHLNEGKNASSFEFRVYDPTRELADRYFTTIYDAGGLAPLVIPTQKTKGKKGSGSSGYVNLEDLSPNMKAMLDTIAWAEGADYNVAFTGATFEGFEDHPRVIYSSNGLDSDASGRYQFLSTTWDTLGLPDFSPENQDRGAVLLIERRGVTEAVEAGNIQEALEGYGDGFTGLAYEWASLPPYRYPGQGIKEPAEVIAYWEERRDYYAGAGNVEETKATESVEENSQPETVENKPQYQTLAGQQVTIILGYDGQEISAYSFLHTGLDYSLFDSSELVFTGQAANWVMGQKQKNSAYQNVSLKTLAQRITANYGLNLDMALEGPMYEFLPQYGKSDYDLLYQEAESVGLRVQTEGNTLAINPREAQDTGFILKYGLNLGTQFTVTHKAQSDFSTGGARAAEPSDRHSTGELKFYVDTETGLMVQDRLEDETATGKEGSEVALVSTTGSHLAKIEPKRETSEADTMRRENEMRIKGITASFLCPTTPEALLLNPDSVFSTSGISPFLDRIWVIESVEHTYSNSGFFTSGVCYTPLKNKFPQPIDSSSSGGGSGYANTGNKLADAALGMEGVDTSAGPGNGNLACVWAVNGVFRKAGLAVPWGEEVVYVPTAEEWLQANGTEVTSSPQPGDIVIAGNQGHIGVYVGGDPPVISNSSSNAAFSWKSDVDFGGTYGSASRVYRLPGN